MKILIAEDEAVIAMDLADQLARHGHRVVATARTLEEALASLAEDRPDLALLDLHLADGQSGADIARRAAAQGTRCVFVTGSPDAVPDALFADCPVLRKPLLSIDLERLLSYLGAPQKPGAA